MPEKKLSSALSKANKANRRLVAPLLGFPGLKLTRSTIKLAQQNYGEHFNVIKAIADTFKPDAVFPLMDLSVEANALGRYTIFPKEESSTVIKDEFTSEDLEGIRRVNISFDTRLQGYIETIKLIRTNLPQNVLCGAYVTGPYTLTALLMGAEEAALSTIVNPEYLHDVCKITTQKIIDYVDLLINAGAEIICFLEPTSVMLGPNQFAEFSGRYVASICSKYQRTEISFVYHICGNTLHLIERMAQSGVNALSLDSPNAGINLLEAIEKVPPEIIIIGNISPVGNLLHGTPLDVENEVGNLLKELNEFPNFILSTGCDLPQETPIENIHAFMETGKGYRIK